MTGQILINYDAVYSKVAELRQYLESELREVDAVYRQAQQAMHGMSGKTQAAFVETMAENQQKARTTAETLAKLMAFIESSARHVERNEQMHARVFASTNTRRVARRQD